MNDNIPTVKSVCTCLETRPPKVVNPLRDLATRRMVPPWVAVAVRDAGELAGETQHPLGLAIEMLQMHMFDVPALDEIAQVYLAETVLAEHAGKAATPA